jgi:hypothetical protein
VRDADENVVQSYPSPSSIVRGIETEPFHLNTHQDLECVNCLRDFFFGQQLEEVCIIINNNTPRFRASMAELVAPARRFESQRFKSTTNKKFFYGKKYLEQSKELEFMIVDCSFSIRQMIHMK